MKAVYLSLMLMASAMLNLSAQNAVADTQTQSNEAVIEFEKLLHDFGNIPLNAETTYSFTFTNTGKAPLVLSGVRASCGCTVPEWPQEPVLPGQKGTIKVKYTTVTRPNVFNKTIIVQSNATNNQVLLRIKGEVVESK